MDVYISSLFLFLTGLILSNGQRCDNNQLRRCREEVGRQTQKRAGDLSSRDCRQFRENFDCLLEQTIACIQNKDERDSYGNEITQAHTALQGTCDREEGWDRNLCYQRDEINRCEGNFPRRLLRGDLTEACRKYEDFQNCVERVINNHCSQGDRAYLRTYYVDLARYLPWKCAAPSSSSGYPGSHRPDYDSTYYRNRTHDNDQRCCKSERCEDRERLLNCRQDLIQIMEGRSNIPLYGNSQARCTTLLNNFNCLLWHTYNCQNSYEKDNHTITNARDYTEKNCAITEDLRRSRCFEETHMRDCERHLMEETPSDRDVTCREYLSYYDCVQRQILRCGYQDELLQGFYLIRKVGDKAWGCSKKDTTYTGYTPHDNRNTYPYDPYSTSVSNDDQDCEYKARREHHGCLNEMNKMDDEARRITDRTERRIQGCCAVYKFQECLKQLVRRVCDRERSSVVDILMGTPSTQRLQQCRDVSYSTCSASQMLNNAMVTILAVAIFRSIFGQ